MSYLTLCVLQALCQFKVQGHHCVFSGDISVRCYMTHSVWRWFPGVSALWQICCGHSTKNKACLHCDCHPSFNMSTLQELSRCFEVIFLGILHHGVLFPTLEGHRQISVLLVIKVDIPSDTE